MLISHQTNKKFFAKIDKNKLKEIDCNMVGCDQ